MSALGEALGHPILFATAIRLAWQAQGVQSKNLKDLTVSMARLSWLPAQVPNLDALVMANAACGLLARLCMAPNTCLTRSLVTAAILSDRDGVVLHVSYPKVAGGKLTEAGHAWVTVGGHKLEASVGAITEDRFPKEVVSIPFRRSSKREPIAAHDERETPPSS